MSRTRSALSPAKIDDRPWSAADEAAMIEAVHAILPEVDFDDLGQTEYLRQAVQEALDDPRPSVPMDEAFETIETRHRDQMRRLGRAVQR